MIESIRNGCLMLSARQRGSCRQIWHFSRRILFSQLITLVRTWSLTLASCDSMTRVRHRLLRSFQWGVWWVVQIAHNNYDNMTHGVTRWCLFDAFGDWVSVGNNRGSLSSQVTDSDAWTFFSRLRAISLRLTIWVSTTYLKTVSCCEMTKNPAAGQTKALRVF